MLRLDLQRAGFFLLLLLLLLLTSGTADLAKAQAPKLLEGVWEPIDSSAAEALFVVDRYVYRVEQAQAPCTLRPTRVRWRRRTALSVEGDTTERREKWRFQLTTEEDTAIVRHGFETHIYARNRRRDPTERCMIDRAEPERRFPPRRRDTLPYRDTIP